MEQLTPREIVEHLDKYIIGQYEAKRAVAVALRNRYRRSRVSEEIRDEITPKNIILMGPTGVGKTEIARRLAKLVDAPFVKVEATKFTEVGYVGRDVESMIRDLVEAAIRMCKAKQLEQVEEKAAVAAEERILDILLPSKKKKNTSSPLGAFFSTDAPVAETTDIEVVDDTPSKTDTREKMRQKLRDGKLEKAEIEIEVEDASPAGIGFMPGNDDMMIQIQDVMGGLFPKQKKKKKTTIAEARKLIKQEEAQKLIDMDEIQEEAVTLVEQNGIVFLDEVDKIAGKGGSNSPDVSREGVQRDILPIVEGSTVNTKYGPVKTDYILFIAAGAFHFSKVSDLIPELQGRFPIHVKLNSLTEDDFKKILTKPENAVIKQQKALLAVEDVHLIFEEDGIDAIAKVAHSMNQTKENIGARRLHTIMETLLEEISFTSDLMAGQEITIDSAYVNEKINDELDARNLGKYIL